MNRIKIAHICTAMAAVLFSAPVNGISQYSRSDPYPVFSADSPLGPFTYIAECEPLQNARISASFFRQAANKVGLFNTRTTYQQSCVVPPYSTDVEIGNMYGPWNILGLFYPEAHGSAAIQTQVRDYLLGLCTGCTICGCTPGDCPNPPWPCTTTDDIDAIRKYIDCPSTEDPLEKFGFMSVPVVYRKYGGRFQLEVGTPYGLGFCAEGSFGRIQQYPQFNDLTSAATPTTTYSTDDQKIISKYIMNQFDEVITDGLDVNVDPYCASDVDDIRFSLWWCHAFEANNTQKPNTYMPKLTFVPYIMAEFSPLAMTKRPYSTLFSIPFGNDGHKAMGVTAGFTVNFVDMFTIGMDGGMTHFSKELHSACPVPTNELQIGVFPRKADLLIRPGKNFSFGITCSAEYIWYNFSAWTEFRFVNHCEDDICLVNMVNVPGLPILEGYPTSNIALDLLEERSSWEACMLNLGLSYDLTDALSLGFFWQIPIRERFAYKSTTLMATIFGTF